MRPVLKPGLRRVWRDEHTLQLGLDPDRAVILTGVEPAVARFIDSLHRAVDPRAAAARHGLDPAVAQAVLAMLVDAGALDDADRCDLDFGGVSTPERKRLGPDAAARSVLAGDCNLGADTLCARRAAQVCVVGAGRVGAAVAMLLGAAGVGTLAVVDDQVAAEADITPMGLSGADVGTSRAAALRRSVAALAPSTAMLHRPPKQPDLVVLAPEAEADRAAAIALVRDGVPHLVTAASEVAGVVGPFVLPGTSTCLHCLDLHRTDRDPGWPSVLAQVQGATEIRSSDVALASMVASVTTLHALAFVEGREPASVNGTLTITLPDGAVRRRSWRPHPVCGCRWEHVVEPTSVADEPTLF